MTCSPLSYVIPRWVPKALVMSVVLWTACAGSADAMTGGITQRPEPGWAVRLDEKGEPNCTGTLVAPSWVLTAGHCLLGSRARDVRVRLRGVSLTPTRLYKHPAYTAARVRFPDIGLVKLPVDAVARLGAATAPMASSADLEYFRDRGVSVFGYGMDASGKMSSTIRKSPDHAWKMTRFCQIKRNACFLRADSAKARTKLLFGDSGGPWMGWRNGGWRVLAVVSGYPSTDIGGFQSGTSPAESEVARWIAGKIGPAPGPAPAPPPTPAEDPESLPAPPPAADAPPTPAGSAVPAGSVAETTGGVTHTWSNPANAGGTQGPTIQGGQTVGIACKLQGFKVANGNPWWYRIASAPWNSQFYASADAFYNNGQTSGSLAGTPWVDPNVPDCDASPSPQPPSTRQIVVDNRVTNGGSQMREDTPAYLSTVMQNFCKRDGCALPGTDMGSGAVITAECTAFGNRTTNGQDNSSIDDGNPGLYSSTRWYGIRWGDGRFGYISEVWIRADFRHGLGLRGC